MKRRDSLKYIAAGSIASGFLFTGCDWIEEEKVQTSLWKYTYGRTPEEIEHDNRILSQTFFSSDERKLIVLLGHIILPPNEFGDIEQAEVPELIEFMAKDYPPFQDPIRKGLAWLNQEAIALEGRPFDNLREVHQFNILDRIAYPDEADPELKEYVSFFTLMRNLTLTGYYTSKVGIEELGYQGNTPHIWDGVPQEILKAHGMAYDPNWMPKFLEVSQRNQLAQWDEDGNLIKPV